MSWFVAVVITGISSFVATNIDDIIILMLFFSQVNNKFRARDIIIGQYLGFTALIIFSLPGLLGGLIIPKEVIGLLGLLPIAIGIKQLLHPEKDEDTIQTVTLSPKFFLSHLLNAKIYNVAAVTIANGADNIGIYIPLFANGNLLSFAITVFIFYLLIAVWCFIAYLLTRQPSLAKLLSHYGHALVPFVLIGLGLYILIESKSYHIIGL